MPAIQALPTAEWKASVLKYSRDQQRWISLLGKYLILRGLRIMGYDPKVRRPVLRHSPYGRPYLMHGPDFNLSHSEDWVVCALVPEGRVGVDLQSETQRDRARLRQVFTEHEIRLVESEERSAAYFWSRKEALSKAIGLGMRLPYRQLEVIDHRVEHDAVGYYLHGIQAPAGYRGHLASTRRLALSYVQHLDLEPVAGASRPRLRLDRFCLQQLSGGPEPVRTLGLARSPQTKIPRELNPVLH
jgi:4'-phosphopantetheinyl transferase